MDAVRRQLSLPFAVALEASRTKIVCAKHRVVVSFEMPVIRSGAHVRGDVVACCSPATDLFLLNVRTQAIAKRPHLAGMPAHPTVLLLDDSPVFLILGEILCRRRGIECLRSASAAECISTLRSQNVAALVVSLMLSKGSGFEVIDWLRETAPDMLSRTLALTEATGPLCGVLNLPVREVFGKPLDFRRLVALLELCVYETIAGPEMREIEVSAQEA